jgi:hypothetical protein
MNTSQLQKRHPRNHPAHLEYLDDRIVPSTLQPTLMAAEMAPAHASVNSVQQNERSAAVESRIEIRRENHMAKIAERREKAQERREKAIERREARLAQFAARHQFSPAVVVRSPVSPVAAPNSTTGTAVNGPHQSARSPSLFGATTRPRGINSPKMPVTRSSITTTPVTTQPVTTTPAPTSPTLPLPSNVSALLDTIYQEFKNGDLPTTNQPGQVEIQGNNIGIQIHGSDPASFASMVANAESMGLQVTTVSDSFDTVVGFLPIANLPAIAQLAGSPSITPLLSAYLNVN